MSCCGRKIKAAATPQPVQTASTQQQSPNGQTPPTFQEIQDRSMQFDAIDLSAIPERSEELLWRVKTQ